MGTTGTPAGSSAPRAASVTGARDTYLEDNGFTVAAYDDAWTHASFFALDFAVPNTRTHRRAIMLHDLHHVATGFGTDLAGEGEISAWEIRAGLRGLDAYVASIIVTGALMGLLLSPRRTLRAFRAGREARALWTLKVPCEELLGMSVAELRALVGAPREGAHDPRLPVGRHKNAPTHTPGEAAPA